MTKVLNHYFFFSFSFPHYITHNTMVKASSSEAGVFITVTAGALNKISFFASFPSPSNRGHLFRGLWGERPGGQC